MCGFYFSVLVSRSSLLAYLNHTFKKWVQTITHSFVGIGSIWRTNSWPRIKQVRVHPIMTKMQQHVRIIPGRSMLIQLFYFPGSKRFLEWEFCSALTSPSLLDPWLKQLDSEFPELEITIQTGGTSFLHLSLNLVPFQADASLFYLTGLCNPSADHHLDYLIDHLPQCWPYSKYLIYSSSVFNLGMWRMTLTNKACANGKRSMQCVKRRSTLKLPWRS